LSALAGAGVVADVAVAEVALEAAGGGVSAGVELGAAAGAVEDCAAVEDCGAVEDC
jgi:hypothetical protein